MFLMAFTGRQGGRVERGGPTFGRRQKLSRLLCVLRTLCNFRFDFNFCSRYLKAAPPGSGSVKN